MFLPVLFILIPFFQSTAGRVCYSWDKHSEQLQLKNVVSIADTAIATIREFYAPNSLMVSVLRSATTPDNYQRQSEILNRVLIATGTDITYTLHEPDHMNSANDRLLRIYNIFFVDNLAGFRFSAEYVFVIARLNEIVICVPCFRILFRRIADVLNSRIFHFAGYYTVVVTETVENIHETVNSILSSCWSFRIVNVNILVYNTKRSETTVYTFFPYSSNLKLCNQVVPIVYDRFKLSDDRKKDRKDIFPDKVTNFHKCPVTVTLSEIPTCIMRKNISGKIYLDQMEGYMLTALSESLNFTIRIHEFNGSKIQLAVCISTFNASF